MKYLTRLSRIMTLLTMLFTVVQITGCSPAAQSHEEKVIRLFNGENFSNFYTFIRGRGIDNDPMQVFTVQNNQIRISGEEWGTIITEDEYENFHLVLEFRWGGETYGDRKEKARDSGIFIDTGGGDGARCCVWMCGI